MRARTAAAAAIMTVAALGGAMATPVTASPMPSSVPAAPPRVTVDETVTTGLTSPWGLAFLPDGSALVSERDTGRVKRIPADGGKAVTVGRVRGAVPQGEGGLLGLAVPPGPNPAYVFAYYTGAKDNRVVRIAWDGSRLGRQTPILTGIPKNTYHDGGRLLVGPGQHPVHRHRRRGRAWPGAGPAQPRRQGAAHHLRRSSCTRQPVPWIARLLAGPPQRAGAGLGQRRTALGERVRPEATSTS